MRFLPLVLALATVAGTAGAQSPDAYKAAVKLENAGSIVDALAMFESIPPEQRDYNTKLHIASCKRKLGRLLEAERDYEAIRTDAKADQPTVETAASDLEDLRARIPKLRVVLSSATAGVTVTLDGSEVAGPGTIKVNPGAHSVVATRATKEVFRRELNVAEGTTLDVEIDAPASAAPSTSPPTENHAVSISAKPGTDRSETPLARTLGFVVGGIGVAAIGGGIYFAVRAADLESEGKAAAARDDASGRDMIDDARGAQLSARIALGIGTVALIGGGVLIATSFGKSPSKPSTATLKVAPAIGAVGLAFSGEF